MKRSLVLTLTLAVLAGCAAQPAPPVEEPTESSPSASPEEQGYNPPPAPDFGDDYFDAPTPENDALAAQVADAFSAMYEWPDAGPFPEVVAFYGRGGPDGTFIEVTTTLVAATDADSPRALEICTSLAPVWEAIGEPDWNNVEVRDQTGAFLSYCTNHATGP
jgi:hypothetical protein